MAKYEDELDLLDNGDVSPTEEEVGQASVRLHDNKRGVLMKRIALEEPWDVVSILHLLNKILQLVPFFFLRTIFTNKLFFLSDLQS